MLKLAALAACAAVASAETCTFTKTPDSCPGDGQSCTQDVLCQAGFYCKVDRVGQGGAYSGKCAKGPKIESVYKQACSPVESFKQCQFENPLAMSPRTLPNELQCSSADGGPGLCLLGPQKHGDGCNEERECASGNCVKALGICQGIGEGDICVPGQPDPCKPGYYCEKAGDTGRCIKSSSEGAKCISATACERGTFCAGPTFGEQRCIKMFSVANGLNTTLGPYMCESANALMVQPAPTPVFQCVDPTITNGVIGTPCDTNKPTPMGFECRCSRQGVTTLRPVGGLGLSARALIWKDLYKCLMKATDPMGKFCSFDINDMETMRYGSCGFYGCYPIYQRLVEATGSRLFKEPLLNFEKFAQCEVDSALKYYERLTSTPCIQIPNMEAWKCASALGYSSLSVQDTQGVISLIFIVVWGGYLYHMWRFRRENGVVFPCSRLNK